MKLDAGPLKEPPKLPPQARRMAESAAGRRGAVGLAGLGLPMPCLRNLLARFNRAEKKRSGLRSTIMPAVDMKAMAAAAGITRQGLYLILSGQREPREDTLERLACAMGCGVGDVEKWVEGVRKTAYGL